MNIFVHISKTQNVRILEIVVKFKINVVSKN